MPHECFLETTAMVDLEFRSRKLRNHLLATLPTGATFRTSAYVTFELARGFLAHLIILHNKATELSTMSELIIYVKNRGAYARYAGQTMLGAYTDFLVHLEEENQALTEKQRLLHFRAWLGPLIRRGWRRVKRHYAMVNPIGCRADLPAPSPIVKGAHEFLEQALPNKHCGQASNCGLLSSLATSQVRMNALVQAMEAITQPDQETIKRMSALQRLLGSGTSTLFKARDCYDCGDALISHEGEGCDWLVTKNGKHYAPLCSALGQAILPYREPSSTKKIN